MEKQIIGQEAPLKNSPRDMTQSRPSAGKAELLGDQAPISRTPVDMTKFWDGGSTDRQLLGSEAPLNTREHHGYEGANTPLSKRSTDKGKA